MPTRGGNRRAANKAFANRAKTSTPMAATPMSTQLDLLERYEQYKRDREVHFWIVQRINPGRGWFDNKYELDYMGSAEFEFGAPHGSLRRMRELGDFRITMVRVEWHNTTHAVYFVAPGESLNAKIEAFKTWLSNGARAKEMTFFGSELTGNFSLLRTAVAWWDLDVDIMWTLEQQVAEDLLYGLQHPATKS